MIIIKLGLENKNNLVGVDNLDNEIINISEKLTSYIRKTEKLYLKIVLSYFFIVLFFVFFTQKYFPELYRLFYFRLSIAVFVGLSLLTHYFMKNTFFIKNRKSLALFNNLLTSSGLDKKELNITDIENTIIKNAGFSLRDIKAIIKHFEEVINK